MSQCPHCWVGQCKTHSLQDNGRREKSLVSKLVDKKGTISRMYEAFFGQQIKRLQADAVLERVDQSNYLKESERDRKEASKKKSKMAKTTQQVALSSALNGSVLSLMNRNEEDDDENHNEIEHKKSKKSKKTKERSQKEKKHKRKSRKEHKRRSHSRSRSRERRKRKRTSSSSNSSNESDHDRISEISPHHSTAHNISNTDPLILLLPIQYNKDSITTTSNDDHSSPSRSISPPRFAPTHNVCTTQNDSSVLFS